MQIFENHGTFGPLYGEGVMTLGRVSKHPLQLGKNIM